MDGKLMSSIDELEKLFSSRMRDYEDKLVKVTSGTTPLHTDLASLSREFLEFKTFVCQTLAHLKTQIGLLSLGLDRQETSLRRKVLLLHGVVEKPNENLCDTISNIFSKTMKLDDVTSNSIEVCHRLGLARGKTRPVLIRFRDMEHRRLVWDSKTSLKDSGITISEFLTKARHQVFVAARKHFGISSCWSAEGKIIVLAPDKSRRRIVSMDELEPLLALFPACPAAPDDRLQTGAAASSKVVTPKATGKVPRKALEDKSSSLFKSVYKTSGALRRALDRHQCLLEATADPGKNLVSTLQCTIEEMLQKELREWRQKVLDVFSNRLQSGSLVEAETSVPSHEYAPAPLTPPYLAPAPVTPPQPDTEVSVIDQLMQTALINKQIQDGDVNGSFERALSASNLSLVMAACRAVDPSKVFAAPCSLQQHVLLSLVQQLATDMLHETQLKCRFLEEAIINLDVANQETRSHLPLVIGEVRKHLSKFLVAYPNHAAGRRITLIVMAANNLLK